VLLLLLLQVDAHLYIPPADAAAGPSQQQFKPGSSGSLISPASPSCYSLDVLRGCSFLLGCGAVLPQLEDLIMQLEVGSAAQAQ
jgi:hypothetical protein